MGETMLCSHCRRLDSRIWSAVGKIKKNIVVGRSTLIQITLRFGDSSPQDMLQVF